MDIPSRSCTAFGDSRRLASGPLREVILAAKAFLAGGVGGSLLVFDDETGSVLDLDLRDGAEEGLGQLPILETVPPSGEPRGRGRPRLGVVAREVTLLPRHWEWLNAQPGGASVSLRKLVEAARKAAVPGERRRLAQERTYRFMSALAGDEPGYEEALRALYAGDRAAFEARSAPWLPDVREHAWKLAQGAFDAASD
ncbi:MAG: DUF2239 family protein [Acidobacteria bacterium]|nr:DUF2239 family protein [Acidobacteriota bacterium]MBI3488131.1 DUF2239 family protein [Acidobacteriota bacterium]